MAGQLMERAAVRARQRPSAEKTAGDSGAEARLRRLAEDNLRHRLTAARAIKEGDLVDYTGYGPAVVLEISGERALVQFKGSIAKMWTTTTLLRPVKG